MTYKQYEVILSVVLNKYPEYDAFLLVQSEVYGKITGPSNIGHSDLQKIQGQSQCETISIHSMMVIY